VPPTAPTAEARPPRGRDSPFYVPPALDVLGWLVDRHRGFWLRLGRLESRALAGELRDVPLRMPVYVAGLARSGSTLLHEVVAAHPGVATHRVKDYPMVFTPYWWRRATARLRPTPPRERAHRDRVLIHSESPDALEEMVWTAFFPRCHDPSVDNRLTAATRHRAFEEFYPAHLRKLLLAERATRYVAKANYHVARLTYLARLFPDARFLIPVRAPVGHVASLMRQHSWFCRGQRAHPRALAFMQRSGHFEFGRDRRPIHLGDGDRVRGVLRAWAAGEEARGWAACWDVVYGHLARLLASDPKLRAMAHVVRFEDLCADPAGTIRGVLAHCELPDPGPVLARFAGAVRAPDYYDPSLGPAELDAIREETAATAGAWGY
jgi:hypothetical protein